MVITKESVDKLSDNNLRDLFGVGRKKPKRTEQYSKEFFEYARKNRRKIETEARRGGVHARRFQKMRGDGWKSANKKGR